jgi:hypothetical protein
VIATFTGPDSDNGSVIASLLARGPSVLEDARASMSSDRL